MENNYARIVKANLARLYDCLPDHLENALGAQSDGSNFRFNALGQACRISLEGVFLDDVRQTGVKGILLSLYALNATTDQMIIEPFRAFKEFPDSMPYAGAFATHAQQILVPFVEKIKNRRQEILDTLDGLKAPDGVGGDFAFVVKPLPKICLCYIFYESDDEFPASVTCLFSSNASDFMPVDGLADIAEYTSKTIRDILP